MVWLYVQISDVILWDWWFADGDKSLWRLPLQFVFVSSSFRLSRCFTACTSSFRTTFFLASKSVTVWLGGFLNIMQQLG